jgi:uncharacterized membrane protein
VKLDSKDLALTSVFAASYAVVNVVQMVSFGNPTVYGPVQLRVADCLIALSALMGWPVVAGVTAGCFLTNAYYFIWIQDVVFGPIANLAAATLVLLMRRHRFIGCVLGALPIGLYRRRLSMGVLSAARCLWHSASVGRDDGQRYR